jgi:hypothetical protein
MFYWELFLTLTLVVTMPIVIPILSIALHRALNVSPEMEGEPHADV